MTLTRIACGVYWSLLTVLLLAPNPAALLGIQKAVVPAGGRGSHFLFFLVLAFLASASRWPARRGVLVLVLVGYALLTEGLQWLVPARRVELLDLGENLLGLFSGVLVWQAWRRKIAPSRPAGASPGAISAQDPDSSGDSS